MLHWPSSNQSKKHFIGIVVFVNTLFFTPYMQSLSVECGLNTACVKIYKKPEGFDANGYFVPLHKRGPDVQLFRGEAISSIMWAGYQWSFRATDHFT